MTEEQQNILNGKIADALFGWDHKKNGMWADPTGDEFVLPPNYSDNSGLVVGLEYKLRKRGFDIRFSWLLTQAVEYRPTSKIGRLFRERLNHAIKRNGSSPVRGTISNLLGCTIAELKIHLEKQFVPGMSWDNHGKWHIDHRKPCAAFDLTNMSEQKECFNFVNLQPLWARDNQVKGAKYEEAKSA